MIRRNGRRGRVAAHRRVREGVGLWTEGLRRRWSAKSSTVIVILRVRVIGAGADSGLRALQANAERRPSVHVLRGGGHHAILFALCLIVLLLAACAGLRGGGVAHDVGLRHLLLHRLVVVVLQTSPSGRVRLVPDMQTGGDNLVADGGEGGGGWLGGDLDP